jgi:NAD(P)-dependent dehydrogenase (short-subunit alcohol dehydrogenase family)
MSRITVITGGAGGMGLATAEIVGRDHTVVLCDVRQDRLDNAAVTLKDLGTAPVVVNCDVPIATRLPGCSRRRPVSGQSSR